MQSERLDQFIMIATNENRVNFKCWFLFQFCIDRDTFFECKSVVELRLQKFAQISKIGLKKFQFEIEQSCWQEKHICAKKMVELTRLFFPFFWIVLQNDRRGLLNKYSNNNNSSMSTEAKIRIVKNVTGPIFDYGSMIYHGHGIHGTGDEEKRLQIAQNSCIWYIYDQPKFEHSYITFHEKIVVVHFMSLI